MSLLLVGKRYDIKGTCRLSCHVAGEGPALLLVHGPGIATSMAEMVPLLETLQTTRTVIALDLPGYGDSERADRAYTPRLMTDALHLVASFVRRQLKLGPRHALDAVAYGISCEFLARAAVEDPVRWGRLGFISPTGLNGPPTRTGAMARMRKAMLQRALNTKLWSQALFDGLTAPALLRYEQQRASGGSFVDEEMLGHAASSARRPGARFAPFYYLSGQLYSPDSAKLYKALKHPVWVSHGRKGKAADFLHNPELERRTNWRLTAFKSGDMPHVQNAQAFARVLSQFLSDRD